MKREDIEHVYDQGKEEAVNLVEGLISEFTDQIKVLTDRIEKLEGQLKKNSHNMFYFHPISILHRTSDSEVPFLLS